MKDEDRFNYFFGNLSQEEQAKLKPTLEKIFVKCYQMGFNPF